ncbi:hypothetical protein LZ31DRAFT_464818 [Colletotrichum somersetense]|nr:hypothetical protein LZ31DRAFT_464818 [Colletotrichum somersetense]
MVDEIVHAVDPEGDVVLVLRNPKAPFAVWECFDWGPEEMPRDPSPEPVGFGSVDDSQTAQNGQSDEEPEVKFLLSSRHLILASRYFSAKLNGTWKEATPHAIDRRYHLEASDWDPEALLILMNVIHGRTRSVPRHVDCEMLAKLAVLIDYYDCHEVIELFTSMWIDALKNQLPSECSRDLVLWLLIAYVFHRDGIFANVTKTAVLKGRGLMPTMDLPIPAIVVDLIDRRRQDAIAFILNSLNDLRDSLLRGYVVKYNESLLQTYVEYNEECSCMILGALERAMYREGLLGLSEAYHRHGVTELETIVRGFEAPSWASSKRSRKWTQTLSTMIHGRLNSEFEKNKEGFSLAEIAMSNVSRCKGGYRNSGEDAVD